VEEVNDSVFIGLLPITSEWCQIELPHMTLVYAGEKKDLKSTAFNELAKDAASIAMLANSFTLKVLSTEIFGGWKENQDKVDVLRLQPSPELLAMRRAVEHWNKSEYPFNPHTTVGPVGSIVETPSYLTFNRIIIGWGNEYITFWLKNT